MISIENIKSTVIDAHKDVLIKHLPADEERDYHLIYTDGLRNTEMKVPEKFTSKNRCELYYCLPKYWKFDEASLENENFHFPITWIKRIMNVPLDRDTYIGEGHSFPAGDPAKPLCEITNQNAFVLCIPIKAKFLNTVEDENGPIQFLGIIPLYKQELHYKLLQGSVKFFERFIKLNHTEMVDVTRTPFRLKKLRFF